MKPSYLNINNQLILTNYSDSDSSWLLVIGFLISLVVTYIAYKGLGGVAIIFFGLFWILLLFSGLFRKRIIIDSVSQSLSIFISCFGIVIRDYTLPSSAFQKAEFTKSTNMDGFNNIYLYLSDGSTLCLTSHIVVQNHEIEQLYNLVNSYLKLDSKFKSRELDSIEK